MTATDGQDLTYTVGRWHDGESGGRGWDITVHERSWQGRTLRSLTAPVYVPAGGRRGVFVHRADGCAAIGGMVLGVFAAGAVFHSPWSALAGALLGALAGLFLGGVLTARVFAGRGSVTSVDGEDVEGLLRPVARDVWSIERVLRDVSKAERAPFAGAVTRWRDVYHEPSRWPGDRDQRLTAAADDVRGEFRRLQEANR